MTLCDKGTAVCDRDFAKAPLCVTVCLQRHHYTVCDRAGAQAATVRHLMQTTAREHFHSRVEEHVCDALMCDMVVRRCVTQGASCIVPHTGHGHTVLCVTRLRPAG